MTRQRICLALVIFAAIGLSSLDILFTPGLASPVVLFLIPTIIAVYCLPPRTVAFVAAFTIVLRLPNLAMLQASVWLAVSHVLALALFGYLSAILADRMRRQTAMDEERGRLIAELQKANEQLERDAARHRAEQESLRASEERYRALAETAHDMIFIVGRDGTIDYVNTFAAEQFRLRQEEIVGKPRAALFTPEISDRQEQSLQEVFRTGMPVYRETKTSFLSHELWLDTWLTPLRNATGDVVAAMGVSRDITERKQQEQQLAYLASHDPLTELPNRRSLQAAMDRAVARSHQGFVSTLVLLDVDNFKTVNDVLGHVVGDRTLASLARLLQKELRFEDTLFRFGGDEFAVLLEGTTCEQAEPVAARLCRAVEEFDLTVEGHRLPLGVSIGAAAIDGASDTSRVLAQADAAMYKAKEQGGGRTVLEKF